MRQYKITDSILKNIRTEFEKALKNYNSTTDTFNFSFKQKSQKPIKKIKIYCLPTAWCKMMTLVQKTDTEIAWHMTTEKLSSTKYVITDVFVYPQTVTGSTVNTDDTKYALWVNALPDKTFNNLRGQGHSHVNMGVGPSSVDTNYYNNLLSTMKTGFYLFMIINKKENKFIQLIDIDNNTAYETEDIDFEIATKSWEQYKWYKEILKNIKHYNYSYKRNLQPSVGTYMETEDDWFDRFK